MPFPDKEASNPGLQPSHQGFTGEPQLLPTIFCSNRADNILWEKIIIFKQIWDLSSAKVNWKPAKAGHQKWK